MAARIPIRNLYYIFLYAWNRFEEGNHIPVGADDSPQLVDLLAKVLIHGTRHVVRRGVARGYVLQSQELAAIRGRINLSQSMNLVMARVPRLVCEFDELDPNILPNQILQATMARLARTRGLDAGLRSELLALGKSFWGVDLIRLDQSVFRRVQLHRNNAYYAFLMDVCELAFATTLPNQEGTFYSFADVLRDERKMALVFQSFVSSFYAIEQQAFNVRSLRIAWDGEPESQEALSLLPTMNTDIVLSSPTRQIIIDTKYYYSALTEYHGKKLLRSENLYQLFAYLKNAEARGPEFRHAEGILLYPAVGAELRVCYRIQGHRMTAATVNLDQPWPRIASELIALVQ